jgi:CRISPR/Cas system endoribonuclease Cas6 (RAMP superfamily)
MPGLVGHVDLEGDFREVWPLVRFAERTQIGKATTFGLGRFTVERISAE